MSAYGGLMSYFLLVYDRTAGVLREPVVEFADHEREAAVRRRFELEQQEREHPNIEVVVLGAASMNALRRTHARYFKSMSELLSDTLATSRPQAS